MAAAQPFQSLTIESRAAHWVLARTAAVAAVHVVVILVVSSLVMSRIVVATVAVQTVLARHAEWAIAVARAIGARVGGVSRAQVECRCCCGLMLLLLRQQPQVGRGGIEIASLLA